MQILFYICLMEFILAKHIGILNHKVYFHNIVYLKANGDYCSLITKDKTYFVHSTFKNMESILPNSFIRIHRSYIINLEFAIKVTNHSVYVFNNVIPISKREYRDIFYERINIKYRGYSSRDMKKCVFLINNNLK